MRHTPVKMINENYRFDEYIIVLFMMSFKKYC